MDEGELIEWHIVPGDEITVGQEIAEIETSKIAGPVEAAIAGKVRCIIAEEGEVLPVGALMAVLAEDSDSEADIEAFIAEFEVQDMSDDTGEDAGAADINHITLGDMDISYRDISPAGLAPGSVPVVLIHGFGGDSNNWLFNQGKIAETHRVIALDLPGHGLSTKKITDGSITGLAAIVAAFLAALDIEQVHLAGHSMGAAVALQCALEGNIQVASLSLICPALVGRSVNPDYIAGFQQARTRKQLKPVLEMLFSNAQLVTRELVDDVLKYKRLDGVGGALKEIADKGLGAGELPLGGKLLMMPVSVIWGDDDKIIGGAQSHNIMAGNYHEYMIENAGHMPHMENAGAVNRILTDLFND